MFTKLISLIFILSLSLVSKPDSEYENEIKQWDLNRIQRLKSENGWLNLAGLFWLDEGKNTFGASKENKIVYPNGKIVPNAGYFERNGYIVKLFTNEINNIKVDDKSINESIVFNSDSTSNPTMTYGDLKWTIIKRENRIGIRLRDLKSSNVSNFKGIERFPIDSNWRVKAKLVKELKNKTISIKNVLGQIVQEQTPGRLVFTINNIAYSLDALDEDGDLFIIFGDNTNENETYPSGRFLIAQKPDENGNTYIDFNKAYNPPCAFTPFATCPLPPSQNILILSIKAGEKIYGHLK